MKSTIKVELGPMNQPVIRMKVIPSDDVRDVLFQQFKESFGGVSNFCYVNFDNSYIDQSLGSVCVIEIAPANSFYLQHSKIEAVLHYYLKFHPYLEMFTSGDRIGFRNGVGTNRTIELDRVDLNKLSIVELVKEISGAIESITAES